MNKNLILGIIQSIRESPEAMAAITEVVAPIVVDILVQSGLCKIETDGGPEKHGTAAV